MWQLGIIIEISSRKELLGPIWSLPGGLGSIIPSACSLLLCPVVVVFGRRRSVQWSPRHSGLNLTAGVDSAFRVAFLFHRLRERFLAEMRKTFFSNWLVGLHDELDTYQSRTLDQGMKKPFANRKIPSGVSPLWFLSPHLLHLWNCLLQEPRFAVLLDTAFSSQN